MQIGDKVVYKDGNDTGIMIVDDIDICTYYYINWFKPLSDYRNDLISDICK